MKNIETNEWRRKMEKVFKKTTNLNGWKEKIDGWKIINKDELMGEREITWN